MMLTVLKSVAILVSGLLGLLALLAETRSRQHKLTKKSKVAIGGIAVSTLTAIFIHGFETQKEIEADRQTQRMLTEVRRAAYRLLPERAPSFGYSTELPLQLPRLASYRKRLQEMTRQVGTNIHGETPWPGTSTFVHQDASGLKSVRGLMFTAESPAFPQRDSEPEIHEWISHFGLDILVFRAGNSTPRSSPGSSPDVRMKLTNRASEIELIYDLECEALQIQMTSGPEDSEIELFTGEVVSLADLAGAEMIVQFRDENHDDPVSGIELEIEREISLKSLSMEIANRRYFLGKLLRIPNEDYPAYSYSLPADLLSAPINLPESPATRHPL